MQNSHPKTWHICISVITLEVTESVWYNRNNAFEEETATDANRNEIEYDDFELWLAQAVSDTAVAGG